MMQTMLTEMVPIAELRRPKRNVRVHPEKQITELARAVEKFGQTRPVVIDEDNTILAGNGLVEACGRLGHSAVIAYRKKGLSAADKTKLMLSDNRVYSLGLDDHGGILEAIRGLELDYDIPGYDSDILEKLMLDTSSVTTAALDNYGRLPEAAVTSARARRIAPGSTEPDANQGAPATNGAAAADITCPQCGHKFQPA
jgi:hypothetical protein